MNDDAAAPVDMHGRDRYVSIARMSWLYPVLSMGLSMLANAAHGLPRVISLVLGVVQLVLMVSGGIMSIVALRAVKKFGKKDIKGPAIAGLVIFVLFLLLMALLIPALLKAIALAKQRH